jgi:hypothetical protein
MCLLCELLGREYVEVSAGALKDSFVVVFGLVAQTPPAQVVIFPGGARATYFYN